MRNLQTQGALACLDLTGFEKSLKYVGQVYQILWLE